MDLPLRIDFAGGWLDVPSKAIRGAFIVNVAISPTVSKDAWPYNVGAGLGGSAAHAVLEGEDSVSAELGLGVGWQDPAIIRETGLCAWHSGPSPRLAYKTEGAWLRGLMAIEWTGKSHNTPGLADRERDYNLIALAGSRAFAAVRNYDLHALADAVSLSYEAQLGEGMDKIEPPMGVLASKYCGGGHGGYVVHIFERSVLRDAAVQGGMTAVEPFWRLAPQPS